MLNKILVDTYKNVKTKMNNVGKRINQLDQYQIVPIISLSILTMLMIEILSRHSILKGLGFIIQNPIMFLFNILIILLTLSFSLIFPKRSFFTSLIIILWVGLGLGNFILLFFRTTPLTAMDFYLLESVFEIIPVYLNTFQIILLILIAPVIIVALFLLWRKSKKKKPQYKTCVFLVGTSAVIMLLLASFAFKVNALSGNFSNLPDAYSNYGFAYCFSNSIFDRGIKEPEDYSPIEIEKVIQKIEGYAENPNEIINQNKDTDNTGEQKGNDSNSSKDLGNTNKKPNIIMVQLESFFDVNLLLDYKFSENPVPNFSQLKKDYSSGYLKVPSIGAGTANTEFEILTGMNIEYFGAGEYPYKTILQTTTCESISYDLSELGYHSHAIHNNTGTFYDRKLVFQKLGFDSFSSIEYMNNVEFNPVGWAKDHVLTSEIMKALEADYDQDFIYTITVQAHGKYPETILDENQRITVSTDPDKRILHDQGSEDDSLDEINLDNPRETGSQTQGTGVENIDTEDTPWIGGGSGYQNAQSNSISDENSQMNSGEVLEKDQTDIIENYKNQFEYYVNQLNATDQFIGELVETLSNYNEPTVVVFFGDHLPSLSLKEDDLVNKNLFQTEYILWSNFPMENIRKDLAAYQLTAYLQARIGYDSGVLTKYHQRCIDEPDYQSELKLLQYDMLYGNRNVFEGLNPYIEKPIRMGVYDIAITDVTKKGEAVFVSGRNFTPWSVVYIGEEPKETIFVDENTLIVPYENPIGQNVYVAQVTDTKVLLSQSEVWEVK